ncbi:MAG: sulfotransferase family protein [Gemmatimonadota bacterium]
MTPPFFIIGFQRSGTTLLRLMLDSHPAVAVPLDVVGLWARYAVRLDDAFGGLATDEDLQRLVEALLAEERIRLWEVNLSAARIIASVGERGFPGVIDAFNTAYAAAKGKRRWGSKDPGDMRRIHLIDEWFPASRFVHIMRDGRDACASLVAQDFGPDDLLTCADAWREEVWWVRRIGRLLGPARYHEVRYEDLVTDPEAVLRPLCAFLSLEFDPAMLAYHARVGDAVPDEKRHIWPLIDRPPQADNVERWRTGMSHGMRVCFEKRARDVLAECGYEVLDGRPGGAYATEVAAMLRRTYGAFRRRFGG